MTNIFAIYSNSDKDLFPCAYPEYDELRESTTFYADFTVADKYGEKTVKDTFNRAFRSWKKHYKYLTELVCVLNHKIWEHYNSGHEGYARVYNELWEKAGLYAKEHLKGEEAAFYYRVLD